MWLYNVVAKWHEIVMGGVLVRVLYPAWTWFEVEKISVVVDFGKVAVVEVVVVESVGNYYYSEGKKVHSTVVDIDLGIRCYSFGKIYCFCSHHVGFAFVWYRDVFSCGCLLGLGSAQGLACVLRL